MSTLHQAGIGEDENEDKIDRIQSVIKKFLYLSDTEVFETRLQKLVFVTEVYCVLHYRKRMTHAEYLPYMYGAFSRDVRKALNDLDEIQRSRTIVHGERTTAYSLDSYDSGLSEDEQRVVEAVYEATESMDTESLAQFSKESWLFENTEYNHPMDFEEFAEALDENREIEEELEEEMPEEIAIDSGELLDIPGYSE